MSIKAIFTEGTAAIVAHGLHQWDYGQTLEVHDSTLPDLVEVHFACQGMKDAVVRACSVSGGVATAAIPDQCLEQSAPVVAWVYVIEGTAGQTVRTITLPIKARQRPQTAPSVPTSFSDRYTELITAVNEQVGALRQGGVVVNKALEADSADHASTANLAGRAEEDSLHNPIHTTYGNFSGQWHSGLTGATKLTASGTYQFRMTALNHQTLLTWEKGERATGVLYVNQGAGVFIYSVEIGMDGTINLRRYRASETPPDTLLVNDAEFYYRQILTY
ncbi:MAG: hypothetical protein IKY65_04505 [Rikenellaceae bacterium]|nr:hypothetical protein [Rikenellaceae bacterium]